MNMSALNQFNCEVGMHRLRGEMRTNEPMSKHTSWRAGGHAKNYFIPADLDDLAKFLQGLPESEPVYVVGLGSNLLVRDGGLDGTVVAMHRRLNDLHLVEQDQYGGVIYIGAGVACAKVARFAALHNLADAEFFAGIPGTVGGALAMNAGCYGSETWELVDCVQTINHAGEVTIRNPEDYEIGYRSVILKPALAGSINTAWFAGGYFKFESGNEAQSRQKIKQLLTRRVNSQPLNQPNAGSVFRNPPGGYAARLIESCGLKGLRIGGAMVSPKHANFIVNAGTASAADIELLIMRVQSIVKEKTGCALVQEVRIIGNARSNA